MYWGIDLGGTKMEGAVLRDLSPESVMARIRLDTEGRLGYAHVIRRIKQLVDQLRAATEFHPSIVGMGTPGTIDPNTGLLKNSNTLCLNGKPFDADLADALGCNVVLANDANCFALAEYHLGTVARNFPHAQVVFGIIMGTGVGGGIVVNGQIIKGHHGIGGEWGHMFLDADGTDCYCGRQGCVETIISGTALERYYFEKTGESKKLQDILEDQDSEVAVGVLERLVKFFGKAVGQIINILDPDVIVIGGGLGQIPFLYSEGVNAIAKNIFNDKLTTPVVPPILGDSAGVFGAAMLTYNPI